MTSATLREAETGQAVAETHRRHTPDRCVPRPPHFLPAGYVGDSGAVGLSGYVRSERQATGQMRLGIQACLERGYGVEVQAQTS